MDIGSKIYNILDKILGKLGVDYVVEEATIGNWTYRKWNSGKAELWGATVSTTSIAGTVWTSPIYYYDGTLTLLSGCFNAKPSYCFVKLSGSQWSVWSCKSNSSTQLGYRIVKASASAQTIGTFYSYCVGRWK